MTYIDGYKQAQADYAAGMQPAATRGWPKLYREGYSDGYWKAQGGAKKW